MQNDTAGAEEAARRHVDNVRTAIADWHARRSGAGCCQIRLPIRRKKPTAIILGGAPASPPVLLWRAADIPRAPSWRLDSAHYPLPGNFQPRFQDLDVNGPTNPT